MSKLKKTNDLADQVIEKLSKATGSAIPQMQSQRRPVNGLAGWSQDTDTGALHHSTHGIISTRKGPNGLDIKHDGKVIGSFGDFNAAGAGIRNYINTLGSKDTGMTNIPSNPMAKEELAMSNYGPKGKSQYTAVDNIKRKANNTGDSVGEGPNTNVKSYSTKPGQLSNKQANNLDFKNAKAKSGKGKIFSREEIIAKYPNIPVVKKSWGQHLPFPSGQPENLPPAAVPNSEVVMANQLRDLLLNKAIIGNTPPPQPTDEEMFGHLVTTPETLAKKEADWSNGMNDFFAEASKPISSRFTSEEEELAYWASIKVADRDNGGSGY